MPPDPDVTPFESEVMFEILVYHYRRDDSSCGCGWAELGHSHPKHVVDVYLTTMKAGR